MSGSLFQRHFPRTSSHNHVLWISILLGSIIFTKIFENRLPLALCTALATLFFYRRLKCMSKQIHKISKGDIEYPSLVSIMDSLQLFELATIVWGSYLFWKFVVSGRSSCDFTDRLILSMLFSQLMFLAMSWVHQFLLSFFFTTCIGHGFFLFSILPRFVAGIRTFLVSFLWFDAISDMAPYYGFVLRTLYVVFKLVYFGIWVKDFVHLLWSKDFPPEFGTKYDANGVSCPVCLEDVMFQVTLPCSHMFCVPCFCRWGSDHLTCPMCRTEFSSWIHQVELQHLFTISLMIF